MLPSSSEPPTFFFYALIQNEEDDGNLNKKIVYLSVPSLSQAIS